MIDIASLTLFFSINKTTIARIKKDFKGNVSLKSASQRLLIGLLQVLNLQTFKDELIIFIYFLSVPVFTRKHIITVYLCRLHFYPTKSLKSRSLPPGPTSGFFLDLQGASVDALSTTGTLFNYFWIRPSTNKYSEEYSTVKLQITFFFHFFFFGVIITVRSVIKSNEAWRSLINLILYRLKMTQKVLISMTSVPHNIHV